MSDALSFDHQEWAEGETMGIELISRSEEVGYGRFGQGL